MIVAGDQQLLKQINRMALVRQLCSEPGLSRAALAEAVGLTKSTVSLLVRELLDEGWLTESELRVTGALGRRATPLQLDGERLALLGADMGIGMARIVATNLLGDVLAEQELPYLDPADTASCIALVAQGLASWPPARRWPGAPCAASASACTAWWTTPPACCTTRPTRAGAMSTSPAGCAATSPAAHWPSCRCSSRMKRMWRRWPSWSFPARSAPTR
jgi:DNA-binding XRE family transcriptional regulator